MLACLPRPNVGDGSPLPPPSMLGGLDRGDRGDRGDRIDDTDRSMSGSASGRGWLALEVEGEAVEGADDGGMEEEEKVEEGEEEEERGGGEGRFWRDRRGLWLVAAFAGSSSAAKKREKQTRVGEEKE